MENLLILFPIILLVIIVGAFFVVQRPRQDSERLPVIAKPVLTKNEIAFFEKLNEAIDDIHNVYAFPEVAMSAFITTKGVAGKERMSVRGKFSQKVVDFLLVDAATNPLLIVELDDSTHSKTKDVARDKITADATIPTIRLRNPYKITVQEIRQAIEGKFSTAPAGSA